MRVFSSFPAFFLCNLCNAGFQKLLHPPLDGVLWLDEEIVDQEPIIWADPPGFFLRQSQGSMRGAYHAISYQLVFCEQPIGKSLHRKDSTKVLILYPGTKVMDDVLVCSGEQPDRIIQISCSLQRRNGIARDDNLFSRNLAHTGGIYQNRRDASNEQIVVADIFQNPGNGTILAGIQGNLFANQRLGFCASGSNTGYQA